MSNARVLACLALSLAACSTGPGISTEDGGLADAQTSDLGDAGARDAFPLAPDADFLVLHDGGAPATCSATCDCPAGLACVSGTCRATGAPVYCCLHGDCPEGQTCLGANDRPGTCPSAEADAGTAPTCGRPDAALPEGRDGGAGSIGSGCESSADCDQAQGYTCWSRDVPPYVWGYCTLAGCTGGCPTGSACVSIPLPPPGGSVTGCMETCARDVDCRTDAYCQAASAGVSICLPDCKDDLLDCSPRNGTSYCSPITGRCAPNSCHGTSEVGGPCLDSQDCAPGLVCMGELAWYFRGGMCTRVCSGLAEATRCGPGETCQPFVGLGLCFKDCVNGACPDRPQATCTNLDTTWAHDSCIPF